MSDILVRYVASVVPDCLNKFLQLPALPAKLFKVLIPRGIVASNEPVEFASPFDRAHVGRVERRPARPLEQGVGDGVGEAGDRGGLGAEGVLNKPALGSVLCFKVNEPTALLRLATKELANGVQVAGKRFRCSLTWGSGLAAGLVLPAGAAAPPW